mmetsp:Transcript_12396/g.9013  ORF Transcript_12396/g.9013 Transcript_12396/m.9013 type:complete len:93 (-) Transcript_12396:740-1018(-)
MERFKRSSSFYVLLDFFGVMELMELQRLERKFYSRIIPTKLFLFPFRTIDRQFILFDNDKLYSVDRSLSAWKEVPMKREENVQFGQRWAKTI